MLNPAYKPVSLRASGAPRDHHDVVMLALDGPNQAPEHAFRFLLPLAEAERIALALLSDVAVQRYRDGLTRCQSPISSGNPSNDGSPQEGQSVYPPARSSNACCGEA